MIFLGFLYDNLTSIHDLVLHLLLGYEAVSLDLFLQLSFAPRELLVVALVGQLLQSGFARAMLI